MTSIPEAGQQAREIRGYDSGRDGHGSSMTGTAVLGPTTTRLRWLAIVVAIMALLTAGWPLVNASVASRQPLAAGSRLTIGTSPADSGMVTLGRGWYMDPTHSNPQEQYVLRRAGLELAISHVSLLGHGPVERLWQGLRLILMVTAPGSVLGAPRDVRTAGGLVAITGPVAGRGLSGTATVFPAPSSTFAIEMVVLAPRDAGPALRAAAAKVVRSFMFTRLAR